LAEGSLITGIIDPGRLGELSQVRSGYADGCAMIGLARPSKQVSEATVAQIGMLSATMLAAVALVDYVTGTELSFSVFYLGPIALFAWRTGARGGAIASVLGAVVWYGIDVIGGAIYSHPLIPLWNALVRAGFFVIVSVLLARLQISAEHERALARTDALTGLMNRRAFEESAAREVERCRRSGHPVSFAFLDLDEFKKVNDLEGHAAGDLLLRDVAGAISGAMRPMDIVGRIGGDEFAMVMPATDAMGVSAVIERLSAEVLRVGSRCSVGAAVFHVPPRSVAEALGTVDSIMYDVEVDRTRGAEIRVIHAASSDEPALR
jgi:diguanylate cyclase (GGDEF)-like protein